MSKPAPTWCPPRGMNMSRPVRPAPRAPYGDEVQVLELLADGTGGARLARRVVALEDVHLDELGQSDGGTAST